MKISARERVLLLIVTMLFFVIMPYFLVIKPMLEKGQLQLAEYEAVSEQAIAMERDIAAIPTLEDEHRQLKETLKKKQNIIPPEEKTYGIHYMLTDLCREAGVTLDSLSIGEYQMIGRKEAEGTQEIPTSQYVSHVKLEVKGTLPQMLDLAEKIKNAGRHLVLTEFVVPKIGESEQLNGSIGIALYSVQQMEQMPKTGA